MQCTRIIHCSSQLKFERGFMYFLQLTSYGGSLRYTVKYETDRTVPYQRHMYGVDVIIQVRLLKDANTHTCKPPPVKFTPVKLNMQCLIYILVLSLQSGNMTIVNGKSYLRENVQEERSVVLNESSWFQLVKSDRYETLQPITKKEFMIILFNIERLLIRATYHSAQNTVQYVSVHLHVYMNLISLI